VLSAQEAARRRHARARHAESVLRRTGTGVELCVRYYGHGTGDAAEGAGIRGMRERALLVGAGLFLGPGPGGGTEVRLTVPSPPPYPIPTGTADDDRLPHPHPARRRPRPGAAWRPAHPGRRARKQIADLLVISPKTVERHRANVLRKPGLKDRLELTRYAIRVGLIEP
jgi:hypothetical protein